ncbi:response regulator transcription factor [Paenibacillus glycanilyticus]|uniref:DNA-binding response regulator n=1 Tax=Paenibacillus glycanilyticus TaxID=126569 RepID=A0ABQ6G971_9BACL|nr:response regulator [Paenibacillus glycanilyticus]GLX67501.1 DNA-binding response regulator [Paenibacillus glycanilyticus]
MFTLILVDDFFVEREVMKDIIEEEGLELRLIGEYANGREALIAMQEELPDFVLTDIEMPIMDGIELSERIKQLYPNVKVIYSSFYQKFEYAKKAIDLEVEAYILKPIIKDEVVQTLRRIIEEKKLRLASEEQEQELRRLLEQSKPVLLQKFIRDFFVGAYKSDGEIESRLDYFELTLLKGRYAVIAMQIDDFESHVHGKGLEEKELFTIYVTKYIEEVLQRYPGHVGMMWEPSIWAVLLSCAGEETELQETVYQIAEALIDKLKTLEIGITVGISPSFDKLHFTNHNFEKAVHALQYKFGAGKGQVLYYDQIDVEPFHPEIGINELLTELSSLFMNSEQADADRFIDQFFGKLGKNLNESTTKNYCYSLVICCQILISEWKINAATVFGEELNVWETLAKYETVADLKQWIRYIFTVMLDQLHIRNAGQSRRIIDETKRYIEKHFKQDISIKTIADHMFYNPNYLNNLFKQETSETILEYITKVRLEEAKRLLLASPNIRMSELVEAVGYKHEAYFRNLFKKYTGLSPKEYRETIR